MQGFQKKQDQYEILETLSHSTVKNCNELRSTKFFVRHKKSNRLCIMRRNDLPNFQTARELHFGELGALMKCLQIPHTDILLDTFVEDDKLFIVIDHHKIKQYSLRNFVLKSGKTHFSENKVRKCIKYLMNTLKELHHKRVKHGNINLDTVMARQRSSGLEIRLTDFARAKLLRQPFNKSSKNLFVLNKSKQISKIVSNNELLELTQDI